MKVGVGSLFIRARFWKLVILSRWKSWFLTPRRLGKTWYLKERSDELGGFPIFNAKQSGESINIDKIGIDSAKKLLLERCIRKAKWVGNHKNSLRVDPVPIEEFSQTFDYGLKDITKLDDFNQVVDWQNSSFYQASNL